MLDRSPVFGSVSVDDLEAAKEFYVGMLELQVVFEADGQMFMAMAGEGTQLMIYLKKDHKPATHTVFNFVVKDVKEKAEKMTEIGVKFEKYPDMELDENGVSTNPNGQIAWFKDPAGNSLAILSFKR